MSNTTIQWTNHLFFLIIYRQLRHFFKLNIISLIPVKKKSGINASIHWYISLLPHRNIGCASFEVLFLQWSEVVEVARCKVQVVCWMGMTFPEKLSARGITLPHRLHRGGNDVGEESLSVWASHSISSRWHTSGTTVLCSSSLHLMLHLSAENQGG
jgi:hypothetical protein